MELQWALCEWVEESGDTKEIARIAKIAKNRRDWKIKNLTAD
jgi:hypothetical protein